MNIKIKKIKKEDLKEVANLFLEVFNNSGESWTYESAYSHVEQNFFGDVHWCAFDENKMVGMMMGLVLTREQGDDLFLDSAVVLPEYQNKGIGKKLWQKAEDFVKENKLQGIRFLANPSWSSYKWYKKMGFKESGWIEMYKKSSEL